MLLPLGGGAAPRRRPRASARGAQAVRWLRLCFGGPGQPLLGVIAMASHNNLALIVRVPNLSQLSAAARAFDVAAGASASEARAVPRQLFALDRQR